MKEDDIEFGSRYNARKSSDNNDGLIKLIVAISIMVGVLYWAFQDVEMPTETELTEAEYVEDIFVEEELEDVEAEIIAVDVEEKEQPMDFYYNIALEREADKDYQGAVEDYEKTISMAKKYSAEMWNSLNNVGIIRAQQFKDYKNAMKDFNRIIAIETNRYDGEIIETRLEAGYTNRAYVKKMQGNVEGACDDLYEALGLGIESSVSFIEKQIDKNCL